MRANIMMVEDDPEQLAFLSRLVETQLGHQVIAICGGRAAVEYFMLRQTPIPSLIICDLVMPDCHGVEVVRQIRRIHASLPIMMLAPYGMQQMAAQALEAGADHYLVKPAPLIWLRRAVEQLLDKRRLQQAVEHSAGAAHLLPLIGTSAVSQQALSKAKRWYTDKRHFMLAGEPGTGKRLCALTLAKSASSLSELSALEALEKGIPETQAVYLNGCHLLSHAQQDMLAGLVHQQDKGRNIMMGCEVPPHHLHDIAEQHLQAILSPQMQRLLEGRHIIMPPLRQRGDDWLLIADAMIERVNLRDGTQVTGLSDAVTELCEAHFWPHNVRELLQMVQRATLHADRGMIDICHLPASLREQYPAIIERWQSKQNHVTPQCDLLKPNGQIKPFDQIEVELIQFTVHHYEGKMTEVAKRLGIGRSTLYRKIQDYNIELP